MSNIERPYSSTMEAIRGAIGFVVGTGSSGGLILMFVNADTKKIVVPGLIFAVVLFIGLLIAMFLVDKASQKELTRQRDEINELESLSEAYVDCMVTTGDLFVRDNVKNGPLLERLAKDLENRTKARNQGSERMRERFRASIKRIAEDWRETASGQTQDKMPVQDDS